jgi:hypothetical protein
MLELRIDLLTMFRWEQRYRKLFQEVNRIAKTMDLLGHSYTDPQTLDVVHVFYRKPPHVNTPADSNASPGDAPRYRWQDRIREDQ